MLNIGIWEIIIIMIIFFIIYNPKEYTKIIKKIAKYNNKFIKYKNKIKKKINIK